MVDRAHCYSTHFFTNLFSQCDPNTTDINFAAVHNHSNAFGGLPVQGDPAITDLYVPTHVGDNHWIMIRVNFIGKAIDVYDPIGNVNPGHRRYMEGLRGTCLRTCTRRWTSIAGLNIGSGHRTGA